MTNEEAAKLGSAIMEEMHNLFVRKLLLFDTAIQQSVQGSSILEGLTVMFIDNLVNDDKPQVKINYSEGMHKTIKETLMKINSGDFGMKEYNI